MTMQLCSPRASAGEFQKSFLKWELHKNSFCPFTFGITIAVGGKEILVLNVWSNSTLLSCVCEHDVQCLQMGRFLRIRNRRS